MNRLMFKLLLFYYKALEEKCFSAFMLTHFRGNQSSRQAVDSSSAKINDEITDVLDDELTVLMRLPEHVLTNYCYTMLSNIWEIQAKKIIKTLLLCFSI